MDISEVRRQIAQQQATVDDVLHRYTDKNGCPCKWPEFEYWVSKPQGPGWQDNIQNDLVEAARKLPCFSNSGITCSNCGRKWRHSSEEWRMLAYHERLIPVEPSTTANGFGTAVGTYFATVGLEPKNARSLSLAEWAQFMLGEPYQPTASIPATPSIPRSPQPLVERVIAWFKRRT